MKNYLLTSLLTAFVLSILASSHAAPTGPSAKAAARLKENPTSVWLAHYLPDDRYKIAGGVWNYVTTHLDTYYHVPNSPNMLRQPNSGVIGFASAKEAEEAGYKPDPRDGTLAQVRGQVEAQQFAREQEAAASAGSSGKRPFVKPNGKVILGDGRSTMVLPTDWQRVSSDQQIQNGSKMSLDIIMHTRSKKMAMLLTMIIPNVNVGRELSSNRFASNMNRLGSAFNSSGGITNRGAGRIGDWMSQAKVSRTRWSGLNGVVISPPPQVANKSGSLLMVGRGNKLYMFTTVGQGKTPANTLQMINSFKAR